MRASPLLLLLALACAGQSPPASAPAGPNPAPAETKQDRKPANPPPAPSEAEPDWSQLPDADSLRAEFGRREDFAERCEQDRPFREAYELAKAESWPDLLDVSSAFLARCPVDIDFHLFRALALSQLDRDEEATRHHLWRRALVESVMRSGRGDSIGSPWIVISVPEEYSVLRALGMQHEGQQLLDGGIDAISVTMNGEQGTVYFFPEAHWLRLQRELPE